MSNLDLTGCKKRKRGDKVFKFKNFGENGYPAEFVGSSFRENVKALVEFGHLESNLCWGMLCWSFQLEVHRHPPLHVLLFVVEEPIDASVNRHCKQCHFVGWGKHMVCNKKYHFLLVSKESIVVEACTKSKCNFHYNIINGTDSGNGMSSINNLVDSQGNVMHGVFHSNGFGHLLCVNGVEKGSDLPGFLILEFWDRLCTALRARKVSLNDISQKRGMELRLIHGIAYKEPWFGRWGYKFGRGTFCVTHQMYNKAIEALQSLPLCLLIHHLGPSNHEIPLIFSRYQTLSEQSLVTLGDLFHFMLELKSHLPKENSLGLSNNNQGISLETTCRWSPKRVEMATKVIVEALKRVKSRWISRQEVRDAARAYVGDTGLLDFVLKSLGNHIVGNYLVRRSLNPVTKVLEYCLEDISNVLPNYQESLAMSNSKLKANCKVTRFQLMKDMFYLNKYIFKDPKFSTGIFSAIQVAVRIVLDSKYLIKEYFGEIPSKIDLGLEGKVNLYCTILKRKNKEMVMNNPSLPPYECITMRKNATIDELKLEVEKIFKEIYWSLRSFVVEKISNLNAKGNDLAIGLVEVGQKLVFEGKNKDDDDEEEEVYESGPRKYVVECICGAKDDDGERMICCDICEIWQHTRCVGIPNSDQVPHIFLCTRCEQEIIHFPSLP
ncbi:hypothetical protein FEM48_Zijuj10G0110200 [Ziziphus jujuba var. spinosa]|uniref:PHD-type domain-containing protein n=1 Tax=Ziziphus jujuba var. spinosa TaxID=714518 RepID=A0A978UMZ9_ZIZJJ|nr:hypothetical protein FEM48_Zijuj10G0110200 [Ziziphus jujuba var. spinosa]